MRVLLLLKLDGWMMLKLTRIMKFWNLEQFTDRVTEKMQIQETQLRVATFAFQ